MSQNLQPGNTGQQHLCVYGKERRANQTTSLLMEQTKQATPKNVARHVLIPSAF